MKALPKFEIYEDEQPKTGCFNWDPHEESIEELDMEFMFDTRKELFDEIESIKKQITASSSKKILKELDEFIK